MHAKRVAERDGEGRGGGSGARGVEWRLMRKQSELVSQWRQQLRSD